MKFTNENWRPRDIKFIPTKEKLTDATGLGTMVAIFDQSSLSKPFAKCLPKRTHARSHGSYRMALMQVTSFLYGHDSLDDLDEFREDPALEAIMKGETVAPKTMGDFLRDFEKENIDALNKYLTHMGWKIREHLREVLPEQFKPKKAVHMSIDSTPHVQSGNKMEGLAFNHKGQWGLDSQVIYDECGLSYGFQLRPGSTYSSEGAEELIEQAFRGKKFYEEKYLSGDSAYCEQGVIKICVRNGIKFTFTAHEARTEWQGKVKDIDEWEPWKYSKKQLEKFASKKIDPPKVELGRFLWQPSWAENLRFPIIVKRTWIEADQPNLFDGETQWGHWKYYAVVTNMSLYKHTKQYIIEFHNQRGNMENFIREDKYGLDLKHFPCQKLLANWAFGLLAQVAHNILRWVAVVEKPHKPHFSKKLRRRFVFIPGKVVEHARQLCIRIPLHYHKEVNRLRQAWQLAPHPALAGYS